MKTRGIPSTSAHRITALVNPLAQLWSTENSQGFTPKRKVIVRLYFKNNEVNFFGTKNSNMDSVHMWVSGSTTIPSK